MMDRRDSHLGVFLCTGCEIGAAVDVAALEKVCGAGAGKHCLTHAALCSAAGVELIHEAVRQHELDGVLIAACSARAKVDAFRFDPAQIGVERVPLREQVAWCSPYNEPDTQALAEDLLRMGIARLSKNTKPARLAEEIERRVLVVGGGVAGLSAARAAAELGHPVTLIEEGEALGGYLRHAAGWVPAEPPYDAVAPSALPPLIDAVHSHPLIDVYLSTRVSRIAGQPGQLAVELETPTGAATLRAGAIVQATGARPYDARRLPHLGYGRSPDVVTTAELERMLAAKRLRCPSDGRTPRQVVFVQCAGSRDEAHLPYCSAECCATSLKQVALVQAELPEASCAVVYRDMRTPGQLERFYLAVQELPGTMLMRGVVERVELEADAGLSVHVRDSLLGEDVALEADLVVLAVGMVPRAADGEAIRQLVDARARIVKHESEKQVADAKAIVERLQEHEGTAILNLAYRQGPDLPALRDGFPDSHYICFPYETRRTGVYAAGTLRAPMDAAQALEDGCGAALKAVQCIVMATRGEAVHPRAGDVGTAEFTLSRCTQCKRCTEECPFGTLDEDVKGTPQYHALRCRRCGICMGACPERIISFPDYSVDGVSSMIKAIEVPDEDEEKPRLLALLCENDALPALDKAAERRIRLSPFLRIIPVRCLGAVNNIWVADALSRGIDGLVMVGCKRGDDYQCHYIRGSELAHTRMSNLKETLERLTLEPERVKIVELAHDESERVAEVLNAFAEEVQGVGPNPYKGF